MDKITINFYEQHKSGTWAMPKIPEHLTTDYEIARWIFAQDLGWIKLDLPFDLTTWQTECNAIKEHFIPHRDTDSQGWNSCCIHGLGPDKTENAVTYGFEDENNAPYDWTALAEKTPDITNFFKNIFPCENYKRIRFMELVPNGYIVPHGDIPEKFLDETDLDPMDFGIPLNIAIIHPDNCHMPFENKGVLPYKEGEMYIPNVACKHSFLNFSNQARVHIIADCVPGNKRNEYVSLLVRSYRKQYELFSNSQFKQI